jgi:RNA polymerase sigma factor (sigma-70 family)
MRPIRTAAARDLGTLFHTGVLTNLSDAQLIERYTARRDDAAFEALVGRHAALVWNVCRRVLDDRRDAEDAFQATFLVLVDKAGSIRVGDSLGPWLRGVAKRVAKKARAGTIQKRIQERSIETFDHVSIHAPDHSSRPETNEQIQIIREEIDRLPEHWRLALSMCRLEGIGYEEAAIRLGVRTGTIKSRVARGTARLKTRLIRRGITLTTALLGSSLADHARGTIVPAALVEATVAAAARYAAGKTATALSVSTSVYLLTKGVEQMMIFTTIGKTFALFAAIAISGVGFTVMRSTEREENASAGAQSDKPQASAHDASRKHSAAITNPPPQAPAKRVPIRGDLFAYIVNQADVKQNGGTKSGDADANAINPQGSANASKLDHNLNPNESNAIGSKFIPVDTPFVVSIHPAAIAKFASVNGKLKKQFETNPELRQVLDAIDLESICGISLFMLPGSNPIDATKIEESILTSFGVIVQTTKPREWKPLALIAGVPVQKVDYKGKTYHRIQMDQEGGRPIGVYSPDDLTIVATLESNLLKRIDEPIKDQSDRKMSVDAGQLAFMIDAEKIKTLLGPLLDDVKKAPEFALFSAPVAPLLEKTSRISVSIDIKEGFSIEVSATCADESSAERVAKTFDAIVTLAQNTAESPAARKLIGDEFKGAGENEEREFLGKILELGDQTIRSARVERTGRNVRVRACGKGDAFEYLIGMYIKSIK